VPALRQLALPGVQIHAPQRPVTTLQLVPLGHVLVDEYPRPSALQVRVPVVPTHIGAPGVQIRVEQVPEPVQVWVSAQGAAE
jgi:hypothetical protein